MELPKGEVGETKAGLGSEGFVKAAGWSTDSAPAAECRRSCALLKDPLSTQIYSAEFEDPCVC